MSIWAAMTKDFTEVSANEFLASGMERAGRGLKSGMCCFVVAVLVVF